MTTKGTDNRFRSLTVVGESGTPATPASGDFKLYVADDGTFYLMDDTGTPTALGGGGLSDPMTTRGDIIVRNASNVTARLAIGSAGKVLSSDGTDVSWQTPSGGSGALVLLEQHTASSSATLDFTTFISSTYDEYMIEGIHLVPATNGAHLLMRAGTGGGPTYDAGSNYYGVDTSIGSNGAAAGAAYNPGSAFELAHTIGNASLYGHANFSLKLMAPQSGDYKNIFGNEVWHDGSIVQSGYLGGIWAGTSAITAVRFLMSSGNIASGTIRAYGVAK